MVSIDGIVFFQLFLTTRQWQEGDRPSHKAACCKLYFVCELDKILVINTINLR